MSIGNFREGNESTEVNEARENTDNNEKSRSQILETSESYDDSFDSRMDNREQKNESGRENKDSAGESERDRGEETGLLDKIKNLFSKRENNDSNEGNKEEKNTEVSKEEPTDRGTDFHNKLREDVPSVEEQADYAKKIRESEENPDDSETGNTDNKGEDRTPGGDAWERRFGRIEDGE